MEYFVNISYMISHIFLMLFIYLFIKHRYTKRMTIGICVSSGSAITLLDCLKLTIFPESDICYVVVTVTQIIITQCTAFFISEKRGSKDIFMGLSASNYVIAGSVSAIILHICTKNEYLALAGSFVVHLGILFLLCIRIRNIWLKSYEKEYMNNWWELCLIPVFFYCSFSFIAFFPHTLYENPDNILGIIAFLVTMFVSYVVILRYVESESERSNIYWKNVMFETYIRGLEDQYYLVEQSEQNLKILRHDMRHYSGMIDTLLSQEEYKEIKRIITYIHDEVDDNKITKYCNNLIVNAILTKIMEKATTMDIEVQLEAKVPKEIALNDYELASVVANLLENAIFCVKEFEKEERRIEGKLYCEEDYLLIEMKNKYKEQIELDPINGLPKSKKGKNHGLGMKSVSAFSDKIGGNVVCSLENGIFHILVYAKF